MLVITYGISQPMDTIKAEKNGIDKLNLLSTHPLGVFHTRISSNFKDRARQQVSMRLQQQSGNVFQPQLEAYLPENEAVRERFASTTWFFRTFDFIDQETTPAQIYQFEFDAVLKVYRVDLEIPISRKSDLQIGLRGFTAVKGNYPWSYFSSDSTIEWFHSNVAGGHDAFGRRFYGLNQVNFNYTDAQGRSLSLKNARLLLGGIEASYHYYMDWNWLSRNAMTLNTGLHTGWNLTKFNRSVDAGLSLNLVKLWNVSVDDALRLGAGGSVLYREILTRDANVSLGNNPFMGSTEVMLEWTNMTTQGNYNSLAIHYQQQTPYRNKRESDYFHLKGNFEINAGWHNAYTTLLEDLSSWSLHYTHGRRYIQYFVYFKEDLKVNNAPDIESGIGVRFKL